MHPDSCKHKHITLAVFHTQTLLQKSILSSALFQRGKWVWKQMTCLAFYYVLDTVFSGVGMWTGMCCCSVKAQGEKKLPGRRVWEKEERCRKMGSGWGVDRHIWKEISALVQTLTDYYLGRRVVPSVVGWEPLTGRPTPCLWFLLLLLWCCSYEFRTE